MLKIPATISQVKTLADGGLTLRVDTQELDPTDEATVMQLKRKLGWMVFAVTENIIESDIPTEVIEFKDDKPLDERLNAVLFAYWMKKTNNAKDFHTFKRTVYEGAIEKYKEKLSELS